MDGRTHTSIRKLETNDLEDNVSGTISFKLSKCDNNQRKYKKGFGATLWQEQADGTKENK